MLTNIQGLSIDDKSQEAHAVDPGMNFIGGGAGNRKIPPGATNWSLRIINGDGYRGRTGGSFYALTAP